jgi:hypothetical protein
MAVRLGVPESVAGVTLVRRLAWVTGSRVILLVIALGAVAVVTKSGFAVGSTTFRSSLRWQPRSRLAGVYAAFLVADAVSSSSPAQLFLDRVT